MCTLGGQIFWDVDGVKNKKKTLFLKKVQDVWFKSLVSIENRIKNLFDKRFIRFMRNKLLFQKYLQLSKSKILHKI
jgi:hypothetical protein